MKKISVTQATKDLDRLVNEAQEKKKAFSITKNCKPVAVLMGYDELESIRETNAIISDKEFMDEIRESIKAFDNGEGKLYTIEELFEE